MSSVDDWEDAGLVEVLLPSGRIVRGKLPELLDLARRDLIPEGLLAWVMLAADPAWLEDPTPDPELDAKVQGYLDQLVVLFVKQVQVNGEWVEKTLDAMRLDRLPHGERYTLELVVAYRLTPEEASARSVALMAGEIVDMQEGEAGVNRLRPFRGGSDGDATDADSEGVEPNTEPIPRAARRRRVPRGRGAGDTHGDRGAANAAAEVEDAAAR